jgi:putative ABC transport system permease protein
VQATLVSVQVALALTLLVGAGLMGTSFIRLQGVNLGFASGERATFTLRLPFNGYSTWPAVAGFHSRVVGALRASPGVTGAAIAMRLPSTPDLLGMNPRLDVTLRDGVVRQSFITLNAVSPSYFDVLDVPIRAGRGFQESDLTTATPNVILSASLARALFGSEDPIGREVKLASRNRFPPYRVVGVSGDVYGERIADGALKTLYLPIVPGLRDSLQMPIVPSGVSFVVRSTQSVSELSSQFRQTVASFDSRVPVWGVRTLDSIVADSMARTRLTMALLGVGALATLLLSVVGLYSVITYAVTARQREFAVRVALGATPASVRSLVMRGGAVVTGLGIAVGLALTYASTRLLRSVLYETSATDPRLYLAGVAVVALATGIAVLVPARRAAQADPAGVLRAE